jgi:predicted acylesterase/phospholipase RssA
LLFDIVAGTSIGAMNGTVLVSQFLKSKKQQLDSKERKANIKECWEQAVKKLEEFWTLLLQTLKPSEFTIFIL